MLKIDLPMSHDAFTALSYRPKLSVYVCVQQQLLNASQHKTIKILADRETKRRSPKDEFATHMRACMCANVEDWGL